MNIVLWIVLVLLAIMFFLVGIMKVVQSKEKMVEKMPWMESFSESQIRTIGILEILGAIGLIVPVATGILPWLTPLAAIGLALLMLGAILTHLRRQEYSNVVINLILLLLTGFVAFGGFLISAT